MSTNAALCCCLRLCAGIATAEAVSRAADRCAVASALAGFLGWMTVQRDWAKEAGRDEETQGGLCASPLC
eukprot:358937-Chlamydomonas_euryale.AAC.16